MFVILIHILFMNIIFIKINIIIIIVPIITWFIWKKVNKKKFVIKIELLKFIIKNLYSKIWIEMKYILKIIVTKINLLFKFNIFILIKIISVILLVIKIIKFINAIKNLNLNIFKYIFLKYKILKYLFDISI